MVEEYVDVTEGLVADLPSDRSLGSRSTHAERSLAENVPASRRLGSRGRPRTRSPTMLRWISSVPPRIEIDGAVRKTASHSGSPAPVTPARPCTSTARPAIALTVAERRTLPPEPSGRREAGLHAGAGPGAGPAGHLDLGEHAGEPLRGRRGRRSRRSPARGRSAARGGRRRPTLELVPPMPPRSKPRLVRATAQPSPSAAMRSCSSTAASSMKTSLKWRSPFTWRSGRTSTPAWSMRQAEGGDARRASAPAGSERASSSPHAA